MEDPFRYADDLGPETIVHVHNAALGLRAILVIDNTAAGPSIGGVRMAPDAGTEECVRLARAMTLKNAAAALPHGGGKSVIVADPKTISLEHKEQLLRAFAVSVAGEAGYIFGPDMGTDERAMAWVTQEGARAVGLPAELGGIPLDVIGATGFGLSIAVDIARARIGLEIDGARLVVQGFGSVGKHAARCLAEQGAVLVAASDSRGALVDPGGIDVAALIAHKAAGHDVASFDPAHAAERDAVLDVDCEIWIPAARPDVLTADNVDRLRTRLVVQGANIPVTADAECILFERGVLSIPDFIANAGGVICGAVELHGGSETLAFQTIEEKVRANTTAVLERAAAEGVTPRVAANTLAEERVRGAMALRRWH